MRLSTLIAKIEVSTINATAKAKPVVSTTYVQTKMRTANALRDIAAKLDNQRKLAAR